MADYEDEDEVTFYNWDQYDQYSPRQKQEIRNYLENQRKVNGKTDATDRGELHRKPDTSDKPRT